MICRAVYALAFAKRRESSKVKKGCRSEIAWGPFLNQITPPKAVLFSCLWSFIIMFIGGQANDGEDNIYHDAEDDDHCSVTVKQQFRITIKPLGHVLIGLVCASGVLLTIVLFDKKWLRNISILSTKKAKNL
jgi:hypothetical protein